MQEKTTKTRGERERERSFAVKFFEMSGQLTKMTSGFAGQTLLFENKRLDGQQLIETVQCFLMSVCIEEWRKIMIRNINFLIEKVFNLTSCKPFFTFNVNANAWMFGTVLTNNWQQVLHHKLYCIGRHAYASEKTEK